MAETVNLNPSFQSSGAPPPLWMLLTAVSGVSDEMERARLIATGLPSLIPCRISGMALLDSDETTWQTVVQDDGQQLDSSQSSEISGEILSLFHEAQRKPTPLIGTMGENPESIQIPPAFVKLSIQELMVVPMRTVRSRLGLVMVGRANRTSFTPEEKLILLTLAQHAAIGFENIRLYHALEKYSQNLQHLVDERTEKLRQAQDRYRLLLEINNAIIANLNRDALLHAIATNLRQLVPFDRASLTLLDQTRDVIKILSLTTSSSVPTLVDVGMEFPLADSHLFNVYAKSQPVLRHHLADGTRTKVEDHLFQEGIQSYVAVPLISKGTPFGTLNLGSCDPNGYSATDAQFLMEVAQQVALAVVNMSTFEEIAQLKARLEQENLYLHEEIRTEQGFGDIVGRSPALQGMLSQLELVAPTDASVLILGESGTGKELVAREIHKRSRRQAWPLVRVNCASIPKELYESEFFGHVKGSFTGALKNRAGRFEIAHQGTLFLDEVGEIPLELQSKLLRVLQEQQYERVGEEQTRQVDVRIIAATNRDLQKEVEAGRFRQDLYYRLNVYPIEVPPLRNRKEDIPLIAVHLLDLAAKRLNCEKPRLTQAHVVTLQNYDWPGNVRELQNVIERAIITWRGDNICFDIPTVGKGTEFSESIREKMVTNEMDIIPEAEMQRLERNNILAALRRSRGKIGGPGGAAQLLGVKPTTLISRIKKLGIKRPGL